jgi:outer membrane usher protein
MTMVIKDAFGREEQVVSSFYLSSRLLKEGLHEFSYNLGVTREEFGQADFKYSDVAFLGFHRFGFSNSFTAGFSAEAGRDVVNAGSTTSFSLWQAGEINLSFALSLDRGMAGFGGTASYLYSGKGFSGRISARGFTEKYANLSVRASENKPRLEWFVGMGYSHERLGSISANYAQTDQYTDLDRKNASLYYSRRIFKDISLYVRASRTWTDDTFDEEVDEVFAGLNIYLGKRRSINLSRVVAEERATETASIQQNPPLGTGFGYRFLAERTEDNEGEHTINGNASIQYRGPFGIYSADYRRIADENSYSLNTSGGLSFINGSLYFSRPITDSFALVKVADLEGVGVLYNNQEVGYTNHNGEVLVPGLISYYYNNLSIEDKDIPVNYDIGEIKKYVSTYLRGGGVVSFEVRKLQAFWGKFLISEKIEKTPAEYWGLEIQLKEKLIEAIVGKGGEFYLENLNPGKYPAKLFLKEKKCFFEIVIPKSDDIMVNMGEITCEMD